MNVNRVAEKKGLIVNTYKLSVKARCPKDHGIDVYQVTLESPSIIFCEDILEWFKAHAIEREVYQEVLTQKAATALGCRCTTVGHHSGIEVTCVSPA